MKVLVLTFYFEPDLCAGSFRNTPFVRELSKRLGENGQVIVLTTMPNRYHAYSVEGFAQERQGNVEIHRIEIPAHKSGMFDQSLSFATYAFRAWRLARKENIDLVYASSSRLMTAVLGSFLSRTLGAPLYLDIRDIFVDTMQHLLPRTSFAVVAPILRFFEAFALNRARRVNLVSEGFLDYFSSRYPSPEYRIFTNGVDPLFRSLRSTEEKAGGAPKTLLYAGNIGQGQGLDRIIPGLASRLGPDWRVVVVGGGGMLDKLKKKVAESGVINVEFHEPVSRDSLVEFYRNAACLFLHLNEQGAFLKVLPSKVFEYAATGKPILAGVAGYAARFIQSEVNNAAVFAPCDEDAGAAAVGRLLLRQTDRAGFIEKFRIDKILANLATDVLDVP